ncbi:MAG: TIGR03619 family F420-dependent LLM class oxidoreductase [Alphaproteobacteria bacterium]
MTIGFAINTNPVREFVEIARHAEAVGFDDVWVGEHVIVPFDSASMHPYAGRPRPPIAEVDDRIYDVWVMVGAILAATTRLTVATGVALAPFRHPLITARAALTAHEMGGARFRLGLGVGWLAEEFTALGVPFAERAARTEEAIAILRKAFSAQPFEHAGPAYPIPRMQMAVVPTDIPIIFGGSKGRAIRRAALLGDGWYGSTIPLTECIAIRDEIHRVRDEHGLPRNRFTFHVRPVGPANRDTLGRYRDAGFENIVMSWDAIHPDDPRATSLDFKRRSLESFAKTVGL